MEWGRLIVYSGLPLVSSIVDTGDSNAKELTATLDKYGFGTGTVNVYIRGSESPFGVLDASPDWSLYSTPIMRAWRWFQMKLEYVA